MTWNHGPQQPDGQPHPVPVPGAPASASGPPAGWPESGPYGTPPYGTPSPPRSNGYLIGGLVAGAVVLVLLLGIGLVWAANRGSDPKPTINETLANSGACDKKLAFFGTLSGQYSALGFSARNGAKLAVKQFLEKHPDCDVELVELDTKDDKKIAAAAADKMAEDASVIGAVGPVYAIDVPDTAPVLSKAGLAHISPAASSTDLTSQGWHTFFRVIGTDASQGPAAAKYLEQIGAERVAIVADTNSYFTTITKGAKEELGSNALKTMSFDGGKPEFGKIIKYIKKSMIHAVYFSGYADDAETFLKKLRAAKLSARVLAPDTAYSSSIVETADKLKHFAVSCTCAPPTQINERFRVAYQQEFGKRPGNYAAEAYDAANVFLDGIADDKASREDMLRYVEQYSERGVTKKITFDDKGEIEPAAPVWFYNVEEGGFVYDRRIG